jgi:hypothetical protein
VLPDEKGGRTLIWETVHPAIWDFSVAYRGEAWAITGGFLPKKYNDVDGGEAVGIVSPPKRQKIETEQERKIREAMETLSYDSSCDDFFQKLAKLLDRGETDFDEVLDALQLKGVEVVAGLAKVSDAQFMTTHLPHHFSSSAKRNLSNLIHQHLEMIPKPVSRIELYDE